MLAFEAAAGQASFGALRGLIDCLFRLADAEGQSRLDSVRSMMDDVLPSTAHDVETRAGFLLSGVAFAVLRRISRESVHTAALIDEAARAINQVISDLGFEQIRIEGMDAVDRPSLKVFARAMLLVEPEDGFDWIWAFAGDPQREEPRSDWDLSRKGLLNTLLDLLDPLLERGPVANSTPVKLAYGEKPLDRYEIAADLVLQNYDRCFLALPIFAGATGEEAAEILRLCAIAAVNIGDDNRAMVMLNDAEAMAVSHASKAHLSYLQGLVCAKRQYAAAASDAHYRRGLAVLEGLSEPELELERGWLQNGMALNEAMRWRRNRSDLSHFRHAFALVTDAFNRIRGLDGPAAIYLRFNLIANSAFLVEMKGAYAQAARLFQKAFDLEGADERFGAEMTLGYRIGVLLLRAGRYDEARSYLTRAEAWTRRRSTWSNREIVLRALAELAECEGRADLAEEAHQEGMALCRRARAAQGFWHHGMHLHRLLSARGSTSSARRIADDFLAEGLPAPGTPAAAAFAPRPVPSKLPAYVPEIDLESVPAVDLNRYMPAITDDVAELSMRKATGNA